MRRLLVGCAAFTAGAAAIGYGIAWECGTFALALCGVVSAAVITLAITWLRQVDGLADYVDRVLSGVTETFDISSNREGEISVLKSELTKLAAALQYQLEEQKRRAARQAANLADISHQLKTPLTALHLAVRRLADVRLPSDDMGAATVTDTARECERLLGRMDWLVMTLLRLSRMDSGTVILARDTLYVSELIDAAIEPLRVAMELRALDATCTGSPRATMTGDFNWTVEALSNILRNCMEHTPSGGSIRVSYDETAVYTCIIIQDTGEGIPPSELPHIFDRFHSTNKDMNNAGIGLSLANIIIRKQNGTIRVRSEQGKGTEFRVEFMKYVV